MLFISSFIISYSYTPDPKNTLYQYGMTEYVIRFSAPDDNPTTEQGVALGRKLFYDPILSGNQKQSCAGCHKQALAFTDGYSIAIGSDGHKAHRSSMALIDLGWHNKFFWDGRASTLESLIHFPVTDPLEMSADTLVIERRLNQDSIYRDLFYKAFETNKITMSLVSKAISQFVRTIVSYQSPFDIAFGDYRRAMQKEFQYNHRAIDNLGLAYEVFAQGNEEKYGHDVSTTNVLKQIRPDSTVLKVFTTCLDCHYNSFQIICGTCGDIQFRNNGLEIVGQDKGVYQVTGKEEDKYKFMVPTLRNLVFTAPYMHDGRFKTLEEVVEHYNSGIQPNENLDTVLMDRDKRPIRFHLTEEEKKQLVGLLKLLTDSSVVSDPRFSDPQHH